MIKHNHREIGRVGIGQRIIATIKCGSRIVYRAARACFSGPLWRDDRPWIDEEKWFSHEK